MSATSRNVPAVMAFSGLDPTGGGGLQADVETVASMGGHTLPVATAITAQDTVESKSVTPVSQADVIAQARAVLEDIRVDAFKIGLLGSVGNAEVIHTILGDYPDIPLVLDPACSPAGAATDAELRDALVSLLLPRALVVTPNLVEARLLAPEADSPAAMAQQIMSYGCGYVLIGGAQVPSRYVENRLYAEMRLMETFSWDRLPSTYRGAGDTLSAAIATLLGHGLEPFAAVHEAQQYTWDCLAAARRIGAGRLLPNRLHWAQEDEQP